MNGPSIGYASDGLWGRLDGCLTAVFVVRFVSTVAGALRLPTTADTGPALAPAHTALVSEDAQHLCAHGGLLTLALTWIPADYI